MENVKYAVQKGINFLTDDGWDPSPFEAKWFETMDEATAAADEQGGTVVVV